MAIYDHLWLIYPVKMVMCSIVILVYQRVMPWIAKHKSLRSEKTSSHQVNSSVRSFDPRIPRAPGEPEGGSAHLSDPRFLPDSGDGLHQRRLHKFQTILMEHIPGWSLCRHWRHENYRQRIESVSIAPISPICGNTRKIAEYKIKKMVLSPLKEVFHWTKRAF
jgi:hypothetical protein